jgi:hypothetical protein
MATVSTPSGASGISHGPTDNIGLIGNNALAGTLLVLGILDN